MFARMIRPFAWAVLVIISHTACDRPKSPPAAPSSPPIAVKDSGASASVARDFSTIHWLGKRRLSADTNSASLMAIWNLPETAKLAEQTLDKLALAPWLLLKGDAATNGAPAALLRPLLADLAQEESHWTFFHPTNGSAGWSLAIRLPADRVSLWQTNLVPVFESLTGGKAERSADGFVLNASSTSRASFHARQSNDWTIIRFGNPEIGSRAPKPPAVSPTNWFSFSLDLAALNRAFTLGWPVPANCPIVESQTTGDGVSVTTRGTLTFARPPAQTLEPWNVPTNFIHDPITGFVACRTGRSLLASLPFWSEWGLGQPPAQFFVWSQVGLPFQTYVAAPIAGASNWLTALSGRLITQNGWLATNGLGRFTNSDGGRLVWADIMIMEPWLDGVSQPAGDWLTGGFFPVTRTNRPAPAELLAQFQNSPTIVYYDWEITEERITDWLYLGQLLRLALHQAQVPPASAGIQWLTSIAAQLGNCGTVVHQAGPDRFTFSRRSSLGVSAVELHLLVDWLESPRFPAGLYSLLAPPEDFTRRNLQKMAMLGQSGATNTPGTNQVSPP